MPKLTKRIVDAADIQPTEYFVWDSDIPGFGLRVLPSGRKGYVVQYRAGRRSRRISLGPNTVLTCEQARIRAITIVAAARNGQDPAAERDAGRKAITIKELAERFDKEHIAIRVKASTGKEYRRNLQRFILPALGQLTVTGVTRADVAKFHHDLRHIPYQANRCLEVISKMFSLSEMWGLRPDGTNPRKHIRKYPEEKRERFLSAAELRRIGEVLREMEAEGVELPSAILAAQMLILTGCRLNEVMSLKWSHIDFDSFALRLPDSKTGSKVVHVGQPVVDLLRNAQHIDGNPWVVTGKRRIIHEELIRTQMLLSDYGSKTGFLAETSHAHIIFYYGLLSLPPPLAITGDDLDEHFQFPVREAIEFVNAYFVARLSELIEQEG